MRHGLLAILLSVSTLLPSLFANNKAPTSVSVGNQIRLIGVVSQVRSDVILVDTPLGQLTMYPMRGLGVLAVGETLSLTLDDNRVIVDVQKSDGKSVKKHHMVRGRLAGHDRNALAIETLEGTKRYRLADPPPNLTRLEDRSEVSAEINGVNPSSS
jgi:hypothetical protein